MRSFIALALSATYAAATTAVPASKVTCSGYLSTLTIAGWKVEFGTDTKASKWTKGTDTCTPADLTPVACAKAAYELACGTDTTLLWTKPTDTTCDDWLTEKKKTVATATKADAANASDPLYQAACYGTTGAVAPAAKAGAAGLTVMGASVVAAIAALAF